MSEEVRIYNCGKQTIPIQLRRPGGDFFRDEQTVYLNAGKTVTLPKTHLNEEQIRRLQATRHIKLLNMSPQRGS